MKTNVSRFSRSAYEDLRDAGELSRQERIVFDTLTLHGPLTREEIEAKTGMRLASVCGRVNSLLGKGVILEVGEKKNLATGKMNGLLDLSLATNTGDTLSLVGDSPSTAKASIELTQEVA